MCAHGRSWCAHYEAAVRPPGEAGDRHRGTEQVQDHAVEGVSCLARADLGDPGHPDPEQRAHDPDNGDRHCGVAGEAVAEATGAAYRPQARGEGQEASEDDKGEAPA